MLFQYAFGLSDNSQIEVNLFPFYPTAAVIFKSELIHKTKDIFSILLGAGMPLIITEGTGVGFIGGFIYTHGERDNRFTIGTNFFGAIASPEIFGDLLSLGYEVRASESVKWLFEVVAAPALAGGKFSDDFPRGITIGPRFFGRNFAADLGLFFPLHTFKGMVRYFIIPIINLPYNF